MGKMTYLDLLFYLKLYDIVFLLHGESLFHVIVSFHYPFGLNLINELSELFV